MWTQLPATGLHFRRHADGRQARVARQATPPHDGSRTGRIEYHAGSYDDVFDFACGAAEEDEIARFQMGSGGQARAGVELFLRDSVEWLQA